MPDSLTLSTGTLISFLLVLARVAGAFAFVPLPGFRSAPEPARAALALGMTLALYSRWPSGTGGLPGAVTIVGWLLAEAATGIMIGLTVAVAIEAFVLAAQVLGLQAGYAYASTFDPNTQADSGVLLVFAQLAAGLLFFAVGLDRQVIRLLADSLDTAPPGVYAFSRSSAEPVIRLGASMISVGLRLAMPVVALLVMVDVALALLGRINAHLQLLSLAFPAKMLAALAMLAASAAVYPRILREIGGNALETARLVLGL
jgi:flagellar biosynthetic protein FliR